MSLSFSAWTRSGRCRARTLLFDLDSAIQELGREQPDHPSAVQLIGIFRNLLRRWRSSDRVRKVFFWVHLTAGVTAGAVILVMSATGALLAFQPQILRFLERGSRRVTPPTPLPERLSPEALLSRALQARPGARPASITFDADPRVAALVGLGRDDLLYLDPFTGAVTGEGSKGGRELFRVVTDWHRFLGLHGDARATGKLVTGACNAAFLFLSVSGVVLWWPRQWTWRHLRPIVGFQGGMRGKARDFNRHNVIGLWCAPAIFFLTLTALQISYPAVGNALYAQQPPGGPPAGVPRPDGAAARAGSEGRGQAPLTADTFAGLDGAWAAARERVPGWTLGVVRMPRGNGPVTVAITDSSWRSPYGRSQLSYDPGKREVAKWEPFVEFARGRKARSAARWLHTGEILSWPGQLAAGVASLGGAFLVGTGLALALRRLRAWLQSSTQRNRAVAMAASVPTASGQSASRESA